MITTRVASLAVVLAVFHNRMDREPASGQR